MAIMDAFTAVRRAGLADPLQVGALGASAARWGPTLAAPYGAAALRHPTRAAVIDHRGELSFSRLDLRSTAFARGLLASGLRAGEHLGLLCANHRDFVEANVAAAKAGLVAVYLNTGFAAPQLAEVLRREQVRGVVCDLDLLPIVLQSGFDGLVVTADGTTTGVAAMHEVRGRAWRHLGLLASRPAPPVLLTSGTTGTPKGARRGNAQVGLDAATGILRRVPYRARRRRRGPGPAVPRLGPEPAHDGRRAGVDRRARPATSIPRPRSPAVGRSPGDRARRSCR